MTLLRRYLQFLERREGVQPPQPRRWRNVTIMWLVLTAAAFGGAFVHFGRWPWFFTPLFGLNAALGAWRSRRDRRRLLAPA